ncbi:MAG: alginate export family protein [Verrucomicrobiota bacterium]
MKITLHFLASNVLLLAVTAAVYAGDYSPTSPVRPSPGLINEWLRKDDPYMAAWDIGVLTRLRYEIRDNFGIAGSPGSLDFRDHGADVDNSFLMIRVRPRIGYTGTWFSVFVEGRASSTTGDDRNPNLESDGPIDLHQAYVTLGNHKEFPLSLKIGRQELSYGDERLIGAFGWNNIGRVFDAAKLHWQNPWFAADFFTSRLVIPNDNNFNEVNDYDWFSGFYATSKLIPKQTTEFYFLSRNVSAGSLMAQGPGNLVPFASPRDIYTVGLRIKSSPGEWHGWDYAAELMGQFGHFNDPALPAASSSLEHRALAVFAGAGYTWTELPYAPRVGIEYNFASGDTNPTDNKHETFDNLFPTNHKFYGFMDFVSLQNIHNVRLMSSIKPLPRLTLLLEGQAFWLAESSDNFYTVGGARRGGIAATPGNGYGINPGYDSYVGSELDLITTYALSPHITLEAGYGHFFRGSYVKQSLSAPTHGSTDADFVYLQTNFNF